MSQDTYTGAPDSLPHAHATVGDVTWQISVWEIPPLHNLPPTSDHELTGAQNYLWVQSWFNYNIIIIINILMHAFNIVHFVSLLCILFINGDQILSLEVQWKPLGSGQATVKGSICSKTEVTQVNGEER